MENTEEDAVEIQDSSSRLDGSKKSKMDYLRVDRKMLPSKMAYFMFYAGMGQYVWYINLFLTSIGLTSGEAGFITGMCFATSAIVGPIWGALSDYTGRRRLIFVILCFFAASTFFSLPWIALVAPGSTLIPGGGNTTINETSSNMSVWESGYQYDLVDQIPTNDIAPFTNKLFWIMLGCLLIVNLFLNPLAGLLDSIVMNVIKKNGDVSSYGLQRLYGSLGGGITPLIGGILADHYHYGNHSKYTAIFYLYLPFMLLMIPIGLYLLKQTHWQEARAKTLPNIEIGVTNTEFDQSGEVAPLEDQKEVSAQIEPEDEAKAVVESEDVSNDQSEHGSILLTKITQTSFDISDDNPAANSETQESSKDTEENEKGSETATEIESETPTMSTNPEEKEEKEVKIYSDSDLAKDIEELLSITDGQLDLERCTSEANIDAELVKDVEELLNATIEELEKNVDVPTEGSEEVEKNTDNSGEEQKATEKIESDEIIPLHTSDKSSEMNTESTTDLKAPLTNPQEEETDTKPTSNGIYEIEAKPVSEEEEENKTTDLDTASVSERKCDKARLLYDIIKQPDNLIFLISVLIGGCLLTITQYFLSMTMKDEMSASGTAGGVAILSHCLAEVLMFPFAKKLISVVGGPIKSIQIGLFCYFVRHLLISIIKNPWIVIAPQLLNSITFAFFIEAVMQYTQSIAPSEIYAIMFTTIYMLHFSLPGLLGNVFGGMIYEKYSGRILYRVSACLALVWLTVMTIYFDVFKRIKAKFTKRKFSFHPHDSFIV